MKAEDFKALRHRQEVLDSIKEVWGIIERAIADARYTVALDALAEVEPITEMLGDEFTATFWPVCRECGGLAEVDDPTVSGRRKVCYVAEGDHAAGKLCVGNRYGRMHPVQLREYIEARIAKPLPPPPPTAPDSEGDAEVQRRAEVVAFMDEVEACEPCSAAKLAAGTLCPKHEAAKATIQGLSR